MKYLLILLMCAASLYSGELKIKIVGKEWGKAGKADLLKVVKSAGNAIWKHCPDAKIPPIQLGNSKKSPISLYARAKNGDLQVKLTSKHLYWAQHSYQFAHEVVHCLCRFKNADKTNLWFEESICETGSLFALRAMSKEWQTKPPYPNWKNYSKALFNYAENLLTNPERQLPQGKTLKEWYQEHKEQLSKNGTDRKKNAVVARELLFMLEKEPEQWGAFYWINEGRTKEKASFERLTQFPSNQLFTHEFRQSSSEINV